jgi:phosphoribosylaminoimidazolecarboxamide formyltransferase/IMP cyclohydrolase
VRARGCEPKSSYGDPAALSEPVDEPTAAFLKGIVSDGIVAPGYHDDVLELLKAKKRGIYAILRVDPEFEPPAREARELFGMRLVQDRDSQPIRPADLDRVVRGELSAPARRDLLLGLVTIKYIQSNSVGYVLDGQMIGIGAGQQSRVDCTKLAGAKADGWWLGRHPKVLGLAFHHRVSRQQRVNWWVRYIEGDLTHRDASLQVCLSTPLDP